MANNLKWRISFHPGSFSYIRKPFKSKFSSNCRWSFYGPLVVFANINMVKYEVNKTNITLLQFSSYAHWPQKITFWKKYVFCTFDVNFLKGLVKFKLEESFYYSGAGNEVLKNER